MKSVLKIRLPAVEDISWLITIVKSPAARVSLKENIVTVEGQKTLACRM